MFNNNPEPVVLIITLKKVKGEKAIESFIFPFTLSYKKYNELIKVAFPTGDEVYKVDEICNNFGINFLDKNKQINTKLGYLEKGTKVDNLTKDDINRFFKIQLSLQDINAFATASEVQALAESITNDLEEIFSIVVEGKYHYYNVSTIRDDDFISYIEDCKEIDNIVYYEEDETEEYDEEDFENDYKYNLDIFAKNGYFETTTGVIYIEKHYKNMKIKKVKGNNKLW